MGKEHMYTETVIFTSHEVKTGNNARGPWTMNKFQDSQGRSFQTFEQTIAAQILATMGQQVSVTFEAKQNGQYTNYEIKTVAANGAAPAAVAPAPQAAPAQATPPQQGPPPQQQNDDERQTRIMRQRASGDAILAFGAAGRDPVEDVVELLEFAEHVLFDYYVNGYRGVVAPVVDAAAAEGPVA